MPYCSNCGTLIENGVNFCPNCGMAISATVATAAPTSVTYTASYSSGYSLVLLAIGTCPETQADDVLQDLLGYSSYESLQILAALPTQVAQGLTETQALYLAQAFTEYGMYVATYLGGTPVDLGTQATASVYRTDGNLRKSVLKALAAITVANRLNQFLRWNEPAVGWRRFRPRYEPKPPVHKRRSIFDIFRKKPEPAPAPTPQPAHPTPVHKAAPGSARNAPAREQAGHGQPGGQQASRPGRNAGPQRFDR